MKHPSGCLAISQVSASFWFFSNSRDFICNSNCFMLLAYSLFSTYFLLKMTFNSLILAKRSSSNLFTRSVLGEVLVYNSNSDWLLPEGPSSLNILSRIVKIGFIVYNIFLVQHICGNVLPLVLLNQNIFVASTAIYLIWSSMQ